MADEFSEKLNSVLANPEAMGQIMSIARNLMGTPAEPPPVADAVETTYVPVTLPEPPPPMDAAATLGALGNLAGGSNPLGALGELDPRLLQIGMRLLTEYQGGDHRKEALLTALAPFIKEERFAKMERAVQIAKLSRVIRIGLQVWKEAGGGQADHV